MRKRIKWKLWPWPLLLSNSLNVKFTRRLLLNIVIMLMSIILFINVIVIHCATDENYVSKLSDDLNDESNMISDENPTSGPQYAIDCNNLLLGQFKCDPFKIDERTQQPSDCGPNNLAPINCTLRAGLICDLKSSKEIRMLDGRLDRLQLAIPCQYTNNYSYEITLILSIFLGMFGIDRFYLGYPAIGLLKFCTLGFLFLGQFIDILLIAMQVVKPADGSNYVIKFFGPHLTIVNSYQQQQFGLFDNIPFRIVENYTYKQVFNSDFDLYFYQNNLNYSNLSSSSSSSSSGTTLSLQQLGNT